MFLFLIFTANSRIVITEVMSDVKGPENPYGDRNEFVEIYNLSSDTIDLSSYFICDFDAPADAICPWESDSILIKYPNVRIHSTIIYPNSYALILDREYIVPDSINCQPYSIPDSTLILTTDDTSIGDGLTTKDPLILFSIADSCTTSFGTPFIEDNFPFDPGDGISWERIELTLPDSMYNWYPSIDPSGCTPGKENSVVNACDLALSEDLITFIPAVLKVGEDASITIGVINKGLRSTSDYQLKIFEDLNKDSTFNSGELIIQISGENVGAFDTTFLYYKLNKPAQGEHVLGFYVEFDADKDLTNNLCLKILKVLGKIGELSLSPVIFTPNNDGKNDYLQIDYRLPEPGGKLLIAVFDARGKRFCDIFKKESVEETKGTCFWSGEKEGVKAQTGMYIVYLEYQYHNKITKAKKTAILAR
ncbi:MAG: gliding motility-associated C-terminal domain-containing protein [candidate division WOR-3 bacterium]